MIDQQLGFALGESQSAHHAGDGVSWVVLARQLQRALDIVDLECCSLQHRRLARRQLRQQKCQRQGQGQEQQQSGQPAQPLAVTA
ncbi:MAG: hypothetical protein IPH51_15195 [Rubrivivax sp.]|nr:hypothetical protein [Rubrivivax sp.]